MVRILPVRGSIRGFGILASLLFLLAMGMIASCHPPQCKKNQSHQVATSSAQDSLGKLFPLPEHLLTQKDLLYKLSKPAKKTFVPDGEIFEGNFGSGAIRLILDEIDGEPNHFYGHLEEGNPSEPMSFIVYGISNEQLDQLVPGQKYTVQWIETVVYMKPFDDDRYRNFVAYRIDKG